MVERLLKMKISGLSLSLVTVSRSNPDPAQPTFPFRPSVSRLQHNSDEMKGELPGHWPHA